MRVMVAMSGGVDSSVAAALLAADGHETVGVTLKLWGGPSDSGCCSVADVDDARRVAQQLGIAHHVFNLSEPFDDRVVAPYVEAHAAGRTPNPCIECNRHVKFDLLLGRARRLGFDALATGHHARVAHEGGRYRLRRGTDGAKDQSYVLAMLGQDALGRVRFPVGDLTKDEVRRRATDLGLRTAAKPDSQDVCFIHGVAGRQRFLADRMALHPGTVVDRRTGAGLGTVDAVELVTVGQRRGLGPSDGGPRRYAVAVDVPGRRVVVDTDPAVTEVALDPTTLSWVDDALPDGAPAVAQTSAHGRPVPCRWEGGLVVLDVPQRPVAPGQTVALYHHEDPDAVAGCGVAA